MATPYPNLKDAVTVMRHRRAKRSFNAIGEKMGKDHKRVYNLYQYGAGLKVFKNPESPLAAHAKKIREAVKEDERKEKSRAKKSG